MLEALPLAGVEPIERRASLSEVTYERLKLILIQGDFPPGEKMTVRSVAKALGVSTTPARDAVNRLLTEGALINEGPKTVVVPQLTDEGLEEITQTRIALEGLAGERSVRNITPNEIAELHRLQNAINEGLDKGNYRDVLQANREFHFTIYRACGWPRLISTIEGLWLRIGPTFNNLYPENARTRRGVQNHMLMVAGLEGRNGAMVRKGIEDDIAIGYVQFKELIAQRLHKQKPGQS